VKTDKTMRDPSNNGDKTQGGRFLPGNRYGKGRPNGSRNRATIALQSLLEDEGEGIARKAVELALAGDTTALRLVMERLIPPTRERRLRLNLPQVDKPESITAAIGVVLAAVADGTITPSEGQTVAALLEAQRKNIETLLLEARIAAIEQTIDKTGGNK
jgi:hypothetical protein